jgi:MPBQ/MSBQ methyltransferase
MTDPRERIAAQFSYEGERADIWRGFDRILPTEAFLNLGYSTRWRPHVVGSPQERLAGVLARELRATADLAGGRLLDVGCGRGGPTVHLAERLDCAAVGVDLVAYNVRQARENAVGADATFLQGDATTLPVQSDAVAACTSMDAVVYVPETRAVYEEMSRVVAPGGVVGVSDLLAADGLDADARATVDAFADAWDMPPPVPAGGYLTTIEAAGLTVERRRDITAHSLGRFRKWARLYLALAEHASGALARALGRWGLDAEAVTRQVRAAHAALPHLCHVLVTARA